MLRYRYSVTHNIIIRIHTTIFVCVCVCVCARALIREDRWGRQSPKRPSPPPTREIAYCIYTTQNTASTRHNIYIYIYI